jgi:hypothetical protein
MLSEQTLTVIAIILILALTMSAVIGLRLVNQLILIRNKTYDKTGNCQECGYPARAVAQGLMGGKPWDAHHANCPIGRLGL